MASILPAGKFFRAFVAKRGVRESKTFDTKTEAKLWAAQREMEIEQGAVTKRSGDHSFHDAIDRFVKEEAPNRKGGDKETLRLAAIKKAIPDKRLDKMAANDFTLWRNARLKAVQGSSVRREMNTLRAVLETARRDWGWIKTNPITDVKRPPNNPPRQNMLPLSAIEPLCRELKYDDSLPVLLERQKVAVAMLLAVETGMRAGELVRCEVQGKVAHLSDTKNGEGRRVPLSKRARELFAKVGNRLDLNLGTLDTEFRDARKRAGLSGFTFHDSRATFCTLAAKRIDVLALAKAIGHRDIDSLMIYYRESEEDIADRL